jgi:ABC-2 type transport system ATP-binding protein
MLQRIGIAQALINDPKLVFLDEPMTGLDPIGRLEVKRIIQRLHDEGRTVLFNSHILADVAELCSRVGIMRGGVVLWSGRVDEARPAAGGSLEEFFMEVVAS